MSLLIQSEIVHEMGILPVLRLWNSELLNDNLLHERIHLLSDSEGQAYNSE